MIPPTMPPIIAPAWKPNPNASLKNPPPIDPTPEPIILAPSAANGVKHNATPATIFSPADMMLATFPSTPAADIMFDAIIDPPAAINPAPKALPANVAHNTVPTTINIPLTTHSHQAGALPSVSFIITGLFAQYLYRFSPLISSASSSLIASALMNLPTSGS